MEIIMIPKKVAAVALIIVLFLRTLEMVAPQILARIDSFSEMSSVPRGQCY